MWFGKRFPDGPTLPQVGGWAEIAAGRNTLIAAPTGSGKTLAAFLICIDRLFGLTRQVPLAAANDRRSCTSPP
jgi:Lhr-like helicase